ncbi:MAG: hypothetical protein JSU63_00995 [Phycisphaerales bacterium]|nr:MAG: hypothetical protein JSU63_00995 [Phycisphaerales bacterium]
MADEEVAALPAEQKKEHGRLFQLVIIALLMGAEGVGVFFLAKTLDVNPDIALAVEGQSGGVSMGEEGPDDLLEVELAECRPINNMSGKLIAYSIKVSALVSSADFERAETAARAKRARIHDRVNFVIRSAELKHLNEPGLETIKRRLKHEIDQVLDEEGLIKAVIIPEMLQ